MKTVLIVDDNPQARDVLRRRLAGAGYKVAEAPGIETAREQLRLARPDVIVADLILPGRGGEELIAELQRKPDRHRVVAMSGAPERLAELLARYPHLTGLPKPFTTEQLIEAVEGAMAQPARTTLRARLAAFLGLVRPPA